MDQEAATRIVCELLRRAPTWIRADLSAADPKLRERAEDALAAMIGAALSESNDPTDAAPPPIDDPLAGKTPG
jgi:hypothetical protein